MILIEFVGGIIRFADHGVVEVRGYTGEVLDTFVFHLRASYAGFTLRALGVTSPKTQVEVQNLVRGENLSQYTVLWRNKQTRV